MLSAPAPGDLFRVLNSTLGRLENFSFCMEIICRVPWVSQVQSIGNLRIFLRAQPCLLWVVSTDLSADIAVDIAVDSRSI